MHHAMGCVHAARLLVWYLAANVDATGNVGALLLQSHNDVHGLVVQACVRAKTTTTQSEVRGRVGCGGNNTSRRQQRQERTLLNVIVANALDGVADDLLVVNSGGGGDLAKHHDHAGLSGSLCAWAHV